jgi:hypothetical protein
MRPPCGVALGDRVRQHRQTAPGRGWSAPVPPLSVPDPLRLVDVDRADSSPARRGE